MSWLNTPIDTQFLTCRIGPPRFKSTRVSFCRRTRAVCSPEKHRSQSTDPEPLKRNFLFSVRRVFFHPSLVCIVSPFACWISSDLSVIGHHVAHFGFYSLLIVLNLPACVCVWALNTLCVFVFGCIHRLFSLCSLQFKVGACCYGNSHWMYHL